MKLRGSRMENKERELLKRSNSYLRDSAHRVSTELKTHGVDPAKAYVLQHTPEQGEDFFLILSAPDRLLRLEVPTETREIATVQSIPLTEYRPRGRPARLRLTIALDLMKENG
jgi:hypothetical protein